jgi:hypothetical protein
MGTKVDSNGRTFRGFECPGVLDKICGSVFITLKGKFIWQSSVMFCWYFICFVIVVFLLMWIFSAKIFLFICLCCGFHLSSLLLSTA